MKDKDIILRVDDAIALCHILDEFDVFNDEVLKIVNEYGRDGVDNLWKISTGKFVFGQRKVKKFYEDNKMVIDKINKYFTFGFTTFINGNYFRKGNLSLYKMYEYLKENENEIEKILLFLERIKELGFREFTLNPNLDFSKSECVIYKQFSRNTFIEYFDNINVMPSYEVSLVRYNGAGSKYEITLNPERFGENNYNYSLYDSEIVVNTLLIDVNSLPESLIKEETFDKIIKLSKIVSKESKQVRDSVLLDVSIGDLVSQFNMSSDIIKKLDNAKSKSELLKVLEDIQKSIEELKSLNTQFDDSILHGDITRERLDSEKKLYLERRYLSNLDLD